MSKNLQRIVIFRVLRLNFFLALISRSKTYLFLPVFIINRKLNIASSWWLNPINRNLIINIFFKIFNKTISDFLTLPQLTFPSLNLPNFRYLWSCWTQVLYVKYSYEIFFGYVNILKSVIIKTIHSSDKMLYIFSLYIV